MTRLRVGTSGWQYDDWRPSIYPPGLGQSHWLARYAELFDTVEVNGTFYRLPSVATVERWAASTPDDFRFGVKASRYLTHVRRLAEPVEPCAHFLSRVRHLGPKLGPVLLQLPPHFPCDAGRLDATLDALGADVAVAVEVRDERWHEDRVYDVLAHHGAALCWWDRRGAHGPLVRTTDWVYLRMHEGRAEPAPAYGVRALTTWCERIVAAFGERAGGWVYFNNDPGGVAAPRNATELRRAAARTGLSTS